MFATDILKVLYAPHKVFKQIVQNPKYLGAIVVLLIFVAAQTAFYYNYYSKANVEQTTPVIATVGAWTSNTTLWQASSGVVISSNYDDFFNSTSKVYGNSSLQFDASASSVSMTLSGIDQVNCGPMGYPNMSMRIKLVQPQAIPEKVTLTLYSLGEGNYFQYDLTSGFASSTTDVWNNFTLPVGSGNWQSTGDAKWENITAINLDFTFSSNSDITVRVAGLFFRGIYQNPIDSSGAGFLIFALQQGFMTFLFEWLVFTALLYIFIKVFKGTVVWKTLFVAVGFALIVLLIQTLVNLAVTTTLPQVYYPVESSSLANIAGDAQAINSVITAQLATFSTIYSVMLLITYVWTAALAVFIIRSLLPEFSWSKSIMVSSAALVGTIILLGLLLGI